MASGKSVELAGIVIPEPVYLCEHTSDNRENRRHWWLKATNKRYNIPKAYQMPGVNEPYRVVSPNLRNNMITRDEIYYFLSIWLFAFSLGSGVQQGDFTVLNIPLCAIGFIATIYFFAKCVDFKEYYRTMVEWYSE